MGICEQHELPLDRNGECELCRLSAIPSQAPPARSALWLVIIPVAVVFAGVVWAFASFGSEPEGEPQRGVQTSAAGRPSPARGAAPQPVRRPEPAPAVTAAPGDAPLPGDIPIPSDVPTPAEAAAANPATAIPDASSAQPSAAPTLPTEVDVPDWKWSLARRQVAITMYATQWCGVCRKAREYMEANGIDFIERDTDGSPAASERLGELNPRRTIPTFEIDELVYVGFNESAFEAKIDQAARKHL